MKVLWYNQLLYCHIHYMIVLIFWLAGFTDTFRDEGTAEGYGGHFGSSMENWNKKAIYDLH